MPRRVGVMGGGWGTRVSVPAFRAAGWEVAALWSRSTERAESEAARLEIPFNTTDVDELLGHPDIDAVAIHSPPGIHLEHCRAAFAAGKHVLLDKPFALDTAEAEQIRRLAEDSGLTTMINYEFRFAPVRLLIKGLLDEGAIGSFRYATMEIHTTNPLAQVGKLWRLDPATGGGVLNELGSHALDRLRQWFGEITSVDAALRSFPPPDADPPPVTEDWVQATCTFADGGIATLNLSWVSDPPSGLRLTIVGSEGVLTAHASGAMLTDGGVAIGKPGEDFTPVPPPPKQQDVEAGNSAIAVSSHLIHEFARGIDEGISPAPNFTDALRSQILIDAVRESAAGGRTVSVSL